MGNALAPRLENAEKTGVLQLSNLKLVKIPEEVKNLQNVRCLDLSNNRLEVIKPWITCFKMLKVLNLDKNKLKCFPLELCSFTKLETLSANQNNLIGLVAPGLSASFDALVNLRFVHLSCNELTEFPVELCIRSIPLSVLDLSNNRIRLIPDCVAEIQAMEINLNNNLISIVTSSIAKCPRLRVLRLDNNQIPLNAFPVELFTDSQVSLICVSGNRFEMREFYALPGYQQYMERFTATKKKAI
ncbi:unnamed protein product [Dicrocoelium dendriticum]|nr:unnamed protein product [Dicrocoelium dendriticum]